MGLMFKLPWGKVCTRTVKAHDEKGKIIITTVPYFKGNPDKYVNALIESNHQNLTACLFIVDSALVGAAADPFWIQSRNIILKKLAADAEVKAGKKL